jgi:hypothetical protein
MAPYSEEKKELRELMRVIRFIDESKLPAKSRYDLIFSNELSQRIFRLLPDFEFDDPDMDYNDDVSAFVRQLEDYLENNHLS